jgi:hypothetical protein
MIIVTCTSWIWRVFMRFRFLTALFVIAATAVVAMPLKRVLLDHARAPFDAASSVSAPFGGVILQGAISTASHEGQPISPDRIKIDSFDSDMGVCFKVEKKSKELSECYYFSVPDEDYFARVFSYVENDGWGAYSAFSDGTQFERDAGIAKSLLGYTAIEFIGNAKLEQLVFGLDYRITETGIEPISLSPEQERLELNELNGSRSPGGFTLYYVRGDLTTRFHARFLDKTVTVQGNLKSYDRTMTANSKEIYYTGIKEFPEFLSYEGAVLAFPGISEEGYEAFLEQNELAYLLALLRTSRNDGAHWATFLGEYFEQR